jgi:hypothetical protein
MPAAPVTTGTPSLTTAWRLPLSAARPLREAVAFSAWLLAACAPSRAVLRAAPLRGELRFAVLRLPELRFAVLRLPELRLAVLRLPELRFAVLRLPELRLAVLWPFALLPEVLCRLDPLPDELDPLPDAFVFWFRFLPRVAGRLPLLDARAERLDEPRPLVADMVHLLLFDSHHSELAGAGLHLALPGT